MERYDNIVKIEEIRRLLEINQYQRALKILDSIDINKIKSLTDLSIIADVYTQNDRYDDAMEVLMKMYNKSKTRRILYQLVELSIIRRNISDAEEYLQLYNKVAPNDFYRFIFRYGIDKLNGEPYEVLISSLEQLKEYEYIEKWAYELAKLYHKAGMKDKCIRECSDIILWFGDGIYVEKAKLLKGYYVGEINPITMLKAKEKREAELKLGLDKTKDYSTMKSQIDRFLREEETSKVEQEYSDTPDYNAEDIKEEENSGDIIAYAETEDMGQTTVYVEYEDPEIIETAVDYEEAEEPETVEAEVEYEQEEELETVEAAEEYLEEKTELEEDQSAKIERFDETEAEADTEEEVEESDRTDEDAIQIDKHLADEISSMESDMAKEDKSEKITTGKLEQFYMYTGIDFEKVFGYFIEIPSCREQIEVCLENLIKDNTMFNYMTISGEPKSGKTSLAKRFAKAFYCLKRIKTTRVAKISAAKLNNLNLEQKSNQLIDGTLIIEEAGLLSSDTAEQLLHLIWKLDGQLIVILEDTELQISKLFMRYPKLEEDFRNLIKLPTYTKQDLFGFVNTYVEENEYHLSQSAKTALLKYIDMVSDTKKAEDQLEIVMQLIKKAKSVTDERNKKELSGIIGTRNLNTTDFLYIQEEDFK